jgi:hypothetical protein
MESTQRTTDQPRSIDLKPRSRRRYGCVRCQAYHYEDEPLFAGHILFQSKHGVEDLTDWGHWGK